MIQTEEGRGIEYDYGGTPPAFNEEHVRTTYRLLRHKAQSEVRAIDPMKREPPKSVFVSNEAEFVTACRSLNGKYNVYVGINERRDGGTKADDVLRVGTIVIDIDAKHPKTQAADGVELKKAEDAAYQILYEMTLKGFNKPSMMMSGNGYQLWFTMPPIELNDGNRASVEEKVKLFQKQVIETYSGKHGVKIDNIGDLPRIIKVAGTLSIKGDGMGERPHRLAFWEEVNGHAEDTLLREHILLLSPPAKPKEIEERAGVPDNTILEAKIINSNVIETLKGKYGERFPSNSEAEMSACCTLFKAGLNTVQVDYALKKYSTIGWNTKTQSYRDLTLKKALEFCLANGLITATKSLDDVHETFAKWMHVKDYDAIDLSLAVALSREMEGTPLWLILVGASGAGKTEVIRPFLDTTGEDNMGKTTYFMAKITTKTLVSGNPKADDLAPLLDKKLIILPDMAEILSLSSDDKKQIWAQLRNLYDGFAQSDTGSQKKRKSYQNLRITLLAGSTPDIDSQILIHQSLGTRELIFRTDIEVNKDELMKRVLENEEAERMMHDELKAAVRGFVDNHTVEKIDIPKESIVKLMRMAEFMALMRAEGKCDAYSGELMSDVTPEAPTRCLKQMKRIYVCLRNLDTTVTDERAIDIVWKLVLSNVNPIRLMMLPYIYNIEESKGVSTTQLAERLHIGKKTVLSQLHTLWNLRIINIKETISEWGRVTNSNCWWNDAQNNPIKRVINDLSTTKIFKNGNPFTRVSPNIPPVLLYKKEDIDA